MKKIRITEKAKPESSAADRTSDTRKPQGQHHEKPVLHPGAPRTVVLEPPSKVLPPDVVVEDETNNRPWDVVDRTRRRNGSQTTEDDREADIRRGSVQSKSTETKEDQLDIANETSGPLEMDHVRNHWANRSNEEPVRERYPYICQAPARDTGIDYIPL